MELLRGGGVPALPPPLPVPPPLDEVARSNFGEYTAPPISLGVEGAEKVSETSRMGGGMAPPLCDPIEDERLREISSKLILRAAAVMLGVEFSPRMFRRDVARLGDDESAGGALPIIPLVGLGARGLALGLAGDSDAESTRTLPICPLFGEGVRRKGTSWWPPGRLPKDSCLLPPGPTETAEAEVA